MTEQDIIAAVKNDSWMMEVLRIVKRLDLPDWWIGAGFVRSKIWDMLHGYKKRTPLPDIDVIYFDKSDFTPDEAEKFSTNTEEVYQERLKKRFPDIVWSVTNQARIHLFHNDKPYISSEEGLSRWVETATCVGVRLDSRLNKIILTAPLGIDDLVKGIIRPNPQSKPDRKAFETRIREKEWLKKWPRLKVVYN